MVKTTGYTHIGKRNNNEDSFIIGGNFAVVADGMGGHQKGEIASTMAVECIRDQLKSLDVVYENDILNAINYANTSIYEKSYKNELMRDMGTTVVMCAWNDNSVIAANVGDSRCYLLSDGSLEQITTDHSYVQSLIDSGEITESEAESRIDKNIILRAAGCEATVDIDIFKFEVKPGDIIILCSDGLSGAMSVDEIKSIIKDCDNDDVAETLVNKAFANGGTDNITAVAVMF